MDESGGLENRYGASHRGFESYSHRHYGWVKNDWSGGKRRSCLLIKGVMVRAIVGSNPTPTAIMDGLKTIGVEESGGLVF